MDRGSPERAPYPSSAIVLGRGSARSATERGSMARQVDVAILGGGLAGNLLARQLRRQIPQASVALFERETERAYKVGESTVEIAANYFLRKLGLSGYLYQEHLPKNGLRFFFDSENRDADLHRMSEIGLAHLPPYPSFQIDRARFECDLLEMNRSDGVDVHVGARITALEVGEGKPDGGFAHRFEVRHDDESTQWAARWVIDATGRAGTLARTKDLRLPERGHRVAAVWGRFRNVRDMDDWAAPTWLARAHHTARALSTNHFCYPGYWIWFIPLRHGVTSVGIVADAASFRKGCLEAEGFRRFLEEHRAPAQLLDGADMVDVGAFTQLAFRTRRFFSRDRWTLLGDAGAFTDPFYSPGSDFIAIENDLTADLIARDFSGEDIRERVEAYEAFLQFRFDVTLQLYQDLYPSFGSFDLLRTKVFFDCACYYNLWFDAYARDEHLDLKAVQGVLRRKEPVIAAMDNFSRAFRKATVELQRQGTYFRNNLEVGLHDGQEAFGPIADIGKKRRRPAADRRTAEIFNRTMALLSDAVRGEPSRWVDRPIWEFADHNADLFQAPTPQPVAPV